MGARDEEPTANVAATLWRRKAATGIACDNAL